MEATYFLKNKGSSISVVIDKIKANDRFLSLKIKEQGPFLTKAFKS